jgi:hypothetical protein
MECSQIPRMLFVGCLLFLSAGCAQQKLLFDKPGLTIENFNRDRYDCVKESNVSWSGGGTGSVGIAMIIFSKSSADNQAEKLFRMCMEARGYTAREVSDEEFERQKNSPLKSKINQLVKQRIERCNSGEFMLLASKSACQSENITFEQLSDKTTISEIEKPVLLKYRSYVGDTNNKIQGLIRDEGNATEKELGDIMERFSLLLEKDAADLIEGKITWGEYNKNRKERNRNYREQINEFMSKK